MDSLNSSNYWGYVLIRSTGRSGLWLQNAGKYTLFLIKNGEYSNKIYFVKNATNISHSNTIERSINLINLMLIFNFQSENFSLNVQFSVIWYNYYFIFVISSTALSSYEINLSVSFRWKNNPKVAIVCRIHSKSKFFTSAVKVFFLVWVYYVKLCIELRTTQRISKFCFRFI